MGSEAPGPRIAVGIRTLRLAAMVALVLAVVAAPPLTDDASAADNGRPGHGWFGNSQRGARRPRGRGTLRAAAFLFGVLTTNGSALVQAPLPSPPLSADLAASLVDANASTRAGSLLPWKPPAASKGLAGASRGGPVASAGTGKNKTKPAPREPASAPEPRYFKVGNKECLITGRVVQPVNLEGGVVPTSRYGWREDPFTKKRRFHGGVDYAGPDKRLVAAADGWVAQTGESASYGGYVILGQKFPDGYYATLFGHLQANSTEVKTGDCVVGGQPIGRMGQTGRATGVSTHFEIAKLDPKQPPPAELPMWKYKKLPTQSPRRFLAAAIRMAPEQPVHPGHVDIPPTQVAILDQGLRAAGDGK